MCQILTLGHKPLTMSSSSINWLVHYNGQIIKIDEEDTFECPHPMFFQTKQGLTLEALKIKIHQKLWLQPLDHVCNISFQYLQVVGCGILKFIVVQLVDDKDAKGMIYIVH